MYINLSLYKYFKCLYNDRLHNKEIKNEKII